MIPILVVDASRDFAGLIQQVLGESGQYEIHAAHSGNEALSIVQEGFVRLAIVDFDLPDVNGADLVVEMRTIYPSLAIIAIPLSNTLDSPELEGLPVEAALTKPFFPPHLPKIVAYALEQVGFVDELGETAELVDPSEITTARFDEDALIDEIQDLFDDQDFAPTEYPSEYDIEAEIAQSTEDTQEHQVRRRQPEPEAESPFANTGAWDETAAVEVDATAETSELKPKKETKPAAEEWFEIEPPPEEEGELDIPPAAAPGKPVGTAMLIESRLASLGHPDQEEPEIELPQTGSIEESGRSFDDLVASIRSVSEEESTQQEIPPDTGDLSWVDMVAKQAETGELQWEQTPGDEPVDSGVPWDEEAAGTLSVPDDAPLNQSRSEEIPPDTGDLSWVDMIAKKKQTGELQREEFEAEAVRQQAKAKETASQVQRLADQVAETAVEQPEPVAETAQAEVELAVSAEPEPEPEATVEAPEPAPPWLTDVDRAAQYLTRLSLETSAVAALLTRGPELWAYAGELSQAQLETLTDLIFEYWDTEGAGGSIARFIRLPDSDSEFMFYATLVAGGIVLSLVFSAETPFGMIRRQAQTLARTLSEIDPAEHVPQPMPQAPEPKEALPQTAPAQPKEPAQEAEAGPESEPQPQAASAQLKETPPEPEVEAKGELPEFEVEGADLPLSQDPGIFFAGLDLPSPDPEESSDEEPVPAEAETPPIPSDWVPDHSRTADHLAFLDEPTAPDLEETLPRPVVQAGSGPLPEAKVDLSFTMVLLPRFPEHRLTGRLAEGLHRWIERLCLAWDWRADQVEIDPAYVAITLTIPPEVAPAGVVSQLREDLSKRVLEELPELGRDLPSGRFWARGFLLKAGGRPRDEHIQAFIVQTRRAQGLAG